MSFAKVRYAALTDVGVKRSHNQDACAVKPASDDQEWRSFGHVFIVADGMGGHAVGEKASAKAVRDVPLTYTKHAGPEGVVNAIRRAFVEANADIYDIGQKNPEFRGLGTTGTALFIRSEGVWIGHVGDSRAYRIRGNKIEQLTFDHSWVWEIARRQGIDPDQLGDFKKNVIVRSLGPDENVEVDIEGPHPLQAGDAFLLCSDGLTNEVPPDEIGAVVHSMPADEAAKFLISLANARGGRDNITCLIVQIPGQPDQDGGNASGLTTGNSAVRKLLTAVDRFLPWPYLALGFGSLLAGASWFLKSEGVSGAMLLFAVAACIIIAGLVGTFRLVTAVRPPGDVAEASTDGELHIYKAHTFDLSPALAEKLAATEQALKQEFGEKPGVDWVAHKTACQEAADAFTRGDAVVAFRARCKAFSLVATVYNQDRGNDDGFRPNYN